MPATHATPPPPLRLLPWLTINSRGRAYLSQDLIQRLGLRNGQAANVLAPADPMGSWYLDLRPRARHKVSWYADTRPRIEFIELPSGLIAPGHRVRLQLVPGEPEFPGYYPLLPDAFFTPKPAPPLAARTSQT